jgi:hypothetical protein
VALFPRWLRCSREQCNQLSPASSGLFELEEHFFRPENTRYVHTCFGTGRRRPTAVPARFLIACPDGHMDDFPWQYFVHRGAAPAHDCTLSLVERGTTGEAANIFVQCSCPNVADRSMAEAMGKRGEQELPACRGHHPHLGTFGTCDKNVRTIALGATNSGVVLGHLADRCGLRGTAVLLSVVTGTAIGSFLFARSFAAFLLSVCLYTCCQCGLAAVRQALLAGLVEPERRTKTRAYLHPRSTPAWRRERHWAVSRC